MKIGVFDSGLGGLIILKAIRKKLPRYDYVYLGDTKRVPYGNRSPKQIYTYAKQCVDFLFKQDCKLIIVACNTVSTEALRKLQQEYLPKIYPNRRILGVIVPTIEEITTKHLSPIGIIGTTATVRSKSYIKEIKKINKYISVYQKAAPRLVPLIEKRKVGKAKVALEHYLVPLLKQGIKALILGCTHYCLLKADVKKAVGNRITILSQDDIIPNKLRAYLQLHPEIRRQLSKKGIIVLLATKVTPVYNTLAKEWFGKPAKLTNVDL